MKVKEGFFIKRPIFATVISIIITLVGLVSMRILPIEQYPDLTPPQVMVRATYNGANAEVIAQTVASVLESQISGVDDMIYMNSVSSSSGSMSLTVTFAIGTDPDMATINVNNRVQRAMTQLPAEVQQLGVTVIKRNPSMLMLVALTSPDDRYDSIFLNNYAALNVVDEIKQVDGVGEAQNFSSQTYSMRLWLNPNKLASLNISMTDIGAAIKSQNAQFAAGIIGEAPMSNDVSVLWQVVPPKRFNTAEEFGSIILRTNEDGSILRLRDVARIELGAEAYNFVGKLNGKDALPIGVFLSPGANALATAKAVTAKMDQLQENFPEGIIYTVPYNTTKFISISIEEVVRTLIEAMILVFIVVFLFLQSIRATLIPAVAVPVSIIGTFAGMYALGFSINTLTMFAMVLSIGMVVDDAIIVLENVERLMATGLSVRKATAQAMQEVTRPVIAVVFVLCSVFIPIAFTGGLTGVMYKQFAITIVISVVISGIVALTFTPAVCLLLLKKTHKEKAWFFRAFDNFFNKVTNGYLRIVVKLLRHDVLSIFLYVLVLAGIVFFMSRIPSGLVPDEDQGTIMAMTILPDGAALSRTETYMDNIVDVALKDPSVESVMALIGFDLFSGSTKSNYGSYFISLKDWKERTGPGESSFDLVKKIMGIGMSTPNGMTIAFNPPAISGMSTTGGFEMWVQNRGNGTPEDLFNYIQAILAEARKRPELSGLNSTMSVFSPELKISVDREKALSMGVQIADIFTVMQSTFGKYYINDFSLYGRMYRVYAQGEAPYRSFPTDIGKVFVRNSRGEMVPMAALVKVTEGGSANTIERFNNFPAAKIMGNPASGYSSGQAIAAISQVAKNILPSDYMIQWSGSAYQEQTTSGAGYMAMIMGLIMVFLILAAQYESWSLPLAVVLSVPFAALGAAMATYFRGYSNDIYFQVAIVTLIGLAAKNAILIVEFAVEKYHTGNKSIVEAAVEGAKLRFRPIVMTSLAFIFGCLPLALSTGAGAASRHVLGTSVVGGMIFATVFAPMFVPFFFKWVMFFSNKFFPPKKEKE